MSYVYKCKHMCRVVLEWYRWQIHFGPFDPHFGQYVQEISKDDHISLENSLSALSHWTKPIYENLDPFLQSNESRGCI